MTKINKYFLRLIVLVVLALTVFRWLILFFLVGLSLPVLLLSRVVQANLGYLTFDIYRTKFPLVYMNPEFAERYKTMRFGLILLADLLSLLLFLFFFYKITPKKFFRPLKKLKSPLLKLKKPKYYLAAIILTIILWFFLLIPALKIGLVAKSLIAFPREMIFLIQNKEFKAAEERLKSIQAEVQVLDKNWNRLGWMGTVPLLGGYYQDANSLIAASSHVINSGLIIVKIIPDLRLESLEETEKLLPQIEKALDSFSLAKEQIDKINPNHYPQKIRGKLIRENIVLLKDRLEKLEEIRLAFRPTIKILPEFISGQKKFLVFFQENDARLTAYGIFRLEKGKIIPEMSGNLNQPRLNEASLRFYQQVGYDGVLIIDDKFLVDLFWILGPTTVYNQTLSSELSPECNCPSIVADIKKLPPARKKEIIGIFLNAALIKSLSSSPKTQLEILFTILESAQEKHLLIYFANPEIQKATEAVLE